MNKKRILFIILVIIALILAFTTTVGSRYVISKKQTLTISSKQADDDVEITINKTTGNINSNITSDTFVVTIKNNGIYGVTYSVTPSSDKLLMSGGVSNVSLAPNSTVDVSITVKPVTGTIYSEVSETAKIDVEVKGSGTNTQSFDLVITTFTYNLKDLILASNTVKDTTPNFAENVTTAASSGMFKMEDESGTSYYYRGVITNNYVSFANKTWRIMRINGDGSYRLILDSVAGTSYYNSAAAATYNNIGYTYGTADSPRGTTSSDMKTYLENWYKSNLSAFDNYIDHDAIFWNDRVVSSTSGNMTYYAGWERVVSNSPSLKPTVKADMYSASAVKGNNLLSEPIGLLTGDELVLAGATMTGAATTAYGTYYENTSYYIYSSDIGAYGIYTMTPRRYTKGVGSDQMIVSKPHASLYTEPPGVTARYVKPVINLKSTVTVKGSGTQTDPYVVKSVN